MTIVAHVHLKCHTAVGGVTVCVHERSIILARLRTRPMLEIITLSRTRIFDVSQKNDRAHGVDAQTFDALPFLAQH